MTLAIMQPYIFPYLGYFQLVSAVDTFVFFDDVNYINKGWINRNQILQQSNSFKFTVPLSKASQNKLINEIELSDYSKWRKDFLKGIENNYKKAPHFTFIFNWLNNFLFKKDYLLISELAADSVIFVSKLLGLQTNFQFSGLIDYRKDPLRDGAQKILNICKIIDADRYINPKNGVELYDRKNFITADIELNFINMQEIKYPQFKNEFVPSLSIIDVLMFNSIEEVKALLTKFSLN